MRVVISGTHASGKSTLVHDLAAGRADAAVLPDPFEMIDGAGEEPDAGMFFAQLRIAATRLMDPSLGGSVIAERGPLDFLAYLDALQQLGRPTRAAELFRRGLATTAEAMSRVDLLVLLPLNAADGIVVPDDEDPELREAMDAALLELADDPDLIGAARIIEVTGDRAARVRAVEAAITELTGGEVPPLGLEPRLKRF